MTHDTMTAERVFELIEIYGAESSAWPEDERDAALALLASDEERFADAIQTARQLDEMLLQEDFPEPSAALAQSILAQAPSEKSKHNSLLSGLGALIFPQGARWPAGAALASLMMGLVGGYAYAAGDSGYDDADIAYYEALAFNDTDTWTVLE